MPNLNKVFLLGNLTREPGLRHTPSGTAVLEFGIAMNRSYIDGGGVRQKEVCFVDITAFGRLAELASTRLAKGQPVFVEGRLKLDSWVGKDGGKRSKLEVIAENFQFLDSRGARSSRDSEDRGDEGSGNLRDGDLVVGSSDDGESFVDGII